VTELVTGIDVVAWQLRVAAGERLPPEVLTAEPRGHAIQVRVYAEDPWNGFAPAAGRIGAWRMPAGPGIRVDAGVEAGSELPTAYDPLLAKLLVHAPDRHAAVARLRRALGETVVSGPPTTLGFHHWLVEQADFVAGRYDIRFVADAWGEGPMLTAEDRAVAAAAVRAAGERGGLVTDRPASVPAPGAERDGAGNDPRPWIRIAREEAVDRG
jgi:acetyl/propionyl-CoA carboxylase alpha subunit